MKRISVFTLLVIASMLLAAFLPSVQAMSSASQAQAASTLSAGKTGSGNGEAFIRLRALMNYDVQDRNGNSLGKANDFVVNLVKSRIDYIVVSLSNGRTVLLPWASLTGQEGMGSFFAIKDDAQRLQNAPEFNASSVNFNDVNWSSQVLSYWRTGFNANKTSSQSSSTSATESPTAQSTEAATPVAAATSTVAPTSSGTIGNTTTTSSNQGAVQGSMNGATAILASKLFNQPVYNITTINGFGQSISSSVAQNQGIPTTGGTGSSSSATASATATPEATASSGSSSSTASTTATPAATATSGGTSATPVPTTGGRSSSSSSGNPNSSSVTASAGDQVGTVWGAVVNRLTGHIPYLLVVPSATISCAYNFNNQTAGVPTTGGTAAGTPVATAVSTSVVASTPVSTEVAPTVMATTAATVEQPTAMATTAATVEQPTTMATTAATVEQPTVIATATGNVSIPATGASESGLEVGANASANQGLNSQVLIPVPVSWITRGFNNNNNQLILRVSPVILANAPVLDVNKLGNFLGWGWDQNYLTYWTRGWMGSRFFGRGIAVTGGLCQSNSNNNNTGGASSNVTGTATPSVAAPADTATPEATATP